MVCVRYVHIHRYTHNYQVPFAIIHKGINTQHVLKCASLVWVSIPLCVTVHEI